MCASCSCGCKPGKPERGCDCKCKMCRAARASESVGKAKFFGGKFVARKTAEVTAANAEVMRASFRGAAKEAEESAARISANAASQANRVSANAARDANRVSANTARDADRVSANAARYANRSVDYAGRTFRRSAIVGSVALGGGLSIPVVVHNAMAGKRDKKRTKMSVSKKLKEKFPYNTEDDVNDVPWQAKQRWSDKRENAIVRRKLLKDPASYGLTGAQVAAATAGGYGAYKLLSQAGPLLARKPIDSMLPRNVAFTTRQFAPKPKIIGLTRRGKMAALLGGGLLTAEAASRGGQARGHRVANRAREEAGYPQRAFWSGKQKTTPKTRSVMSKQSYLLGSGVTLVEMSKAMSPNKLQSLQRMANSSRTPRADAEYARNRLTSYRVGQGASPSPSQKEGFVRAARSAASSPAYRARNYGAGRRVSNAGVAASSSANTAGRGYDDYMSVGSRKLRMKNGFQDRLGYRLP